ncbi:peptidase domain-containing ABC transporter [Nitrospirillum iridis]|uniref:ATP-binding cassette subfamily B protein RaxB n=1 Tax=Nitrospirillum iridis TaxID=765888 RepID=A0A7X0AUU6_9PROT|nr:peptidase domain-containing ABC transporter [Nitrospirillum iridis]MBB6250082.1 ATP-binding cassette subfamily B protein RaxB [Nitrospirillum iridis]
MTDILSLLNFTFRRRLSVVYQAEAAECGLACLAMVANYYGLESSLTTLRQRFSTSMKGTNLKTLVGIAGQLGLASNPLRVELEHLTKLQLPAILHWDLKHFVVLTAVSGGRVTIADPSKGEFSLGLAEFSKHFTGVVLELRPTADFRPQKEERSVRFADFWQKISGMGTAATHLLVLAAIVQLLVIAMPFYSQIAVDEVIVKNDTDLLPAVAIIFGGVATITWIATLTRSWFTTHISNMLIYQLSSNLFSHLVRLPLSFFETRHSGDIVARFGSLKTIQKSLTEGLITSLIDGGFGILTLCIMFFYSAELSAITCVSSVITLVLTKVYLERVSARNHANIVASSRESSFFLETIRAIQSLKLYGREAERQVAWQHHLADSVNTNVLAGRERSVFDSTADFIGTVEMVVVTYFGVRAVLNGGFTVGMLMAFMAYRNMFSTRLRSVQTQVMELRLVRLHLTRLGDMLHTEPEPIAFQRSGATRSVQGTLTLRNCGFRYSNDEDFVFRNIDLTIEAGECVAITGVTGVGKTTLIKVMLGLLPPTEGDVLIDGMPIHRFGISDFRAQIGAVMQEDRLLSGSILDNITFFDLAGDRDRAVDAARRAHIHDEIEATTMRYQTLIGDMGSSLSAGQKQRVLLARALYHAPRILFLDEGTANLDQETEMAVGRSIAALGVTRIIVAHRPATIQFCNRVLQLNREGLVTLKQTPPAAAVANSYR